MVARHLEQTSAPDGDTVLAKVAELLDTVPATRHNYSLLLLMYWLVYDDVLSYIQADDEVKTSVIGQLTQAVSLYATKPETITRARRLLMANARKAMRKEINNGTETNHSTD